MPVELVELAQRLFCTAALDLKKPPAGQDAGFMVLSPVT